ncbi:MAG: amidohydrolase family protein [Bacillota bacterium]
MTRTLIKAGRFFDGLKTSEVRKNVFITLNGDKVESVSDIQPEGQFDQTLDYSGYTVLPGLIDTHTHLAFNGHESLFKLAKDPRDKLAYEAVESLRVTLLAGITTCRDVGGFEHLDLSMKKYVEAGVLTGPRMFVSGKMITATGGHCWIIATEANGPAEIRRAVREEIKAGVDMIKLMATGGGATPGQNLNAVQLELDEIKAACEVAHSNYRKVGVHAHGADGIKRVVEGGVDMVDHCSLLDEEGAKMMKDRGTFMVLTPGHENMFPDLDPDWIRRMMPLRSRAAKTMEIALKHELDIAIGTDAGGNPYAPHGKLWFCLKEAVESGMSAKDAIVGVTSNAARCIGIDTLLGSIVPGKLADIAVFKGNPVERIEDSEHVVAVIKGGQLVRG